MLLSVGMFVSRCLILSLLLSASSSAAQRGPEPGSPGPETPDLGSPGPETPDPGSLHPETPDPGSLHPETPDPGSLHFETPQPGSLHLGTPDPGTFHFETPHPGSLHLGTPDPETPDPGTLHFETPHPGSLHLGTPDPKTPDPGTLHLGTHGSHHPGTPEPGFVDPSPLHPGTPGPGSLHPRIPDPSSLHPGTPDIRSLSTGSPDPGGFDPRTPDPGSPDHVTAKSLTTAVPICTCDLAEGVCELNCCCDRDCSSVDIGAFSSCLRGSQPVVSQVCVEESVIFTSNTPFQTVINKGDLDTLFCVIVDDAKANYFVTPQSLRREKLPLLVSQFGRGSFIVSSEPENSTRILASSKDVYKVGDRIMMLFPHIVMMGFLMLPLALTGGECTDRNPAGFLQDCSSSCTRNVGDLNATCQFLPALIAETYFENFLLLPVRILNEGPAIADSPFVWNNKCMHVVSEVNYKIEHSEDEGIYAASVSFVLSDVPLSNTRIQQSFHISFRNVLTSGTGRSRSGNPGYLIGKPILAFNGNVATDLTILRSTVDGSCSPPVRSLVLFKHQMQTGCLYRFDHGLTCSELQAQINLLLLGSNHPDSLGMLGNASSTNLESLTRIINLMPEASNVTCATSCALSLELEMQILWANLGPLANPQAAVLGARFQYQRQEIQCSTGRASLQTSVTFIETTRYPPAPRDQPAIDQKLPFDFFYPFKVINSGAGSMFAGSMLGSVCTVLLTGLLSHR
ncbi:tectonic-3-like isoform X2 [Scyliorhinus torazame]|uniref:tectonic-3-like isoform X2 n=1 Tax=Scyliorhinus torazame TaxID=75743 RepID=UPI003B5CD9D0